MIAKVVGNPANAKASLSDFQVICTIGSGSYGVVKKIRRINDNKIFVWKELDFSSADELEKKMLISEANLLRGFKHENIVKYVDRIIDKKRSTLFLIMEYCENGDLASYIKQAKNEGHNIEESFVWKVCRQLTDAIRECHSRSACGKLILHRDLKPANIFLDAQLNVKLGDFGIARVLNHEFSFAKTYVGTPLYMSPEQVSGKEYNEKCDIWALGCLLYELCCLKPPFSARNQMELATKICAGRFDPIPDVYSFDLRHLIYSLLTVDVNKRPSIDALFRRNEIKNCSSLPNTVSQANVTSEVLSALVNDEVHKLRQENASLKAELEDKACNLQNLNDELKNVVHEVKKKLTMLSVRECNLKAAEIKAQDRISKAEKLLEIYSEKNLALHVTNSDNRENECEFLKKANNSPWRRVSSPSIATPPISISPLNDRPKSDKMEELKIVNKFLHRQSDAAYKRDNPEISKFKSLFISPKCISQRIKEEVQQRVIKSEDRKPLKKLNKIEPYKEL